MRLSGTGIWSGQLRYGDAGVDRGGGRRARRARLRRDLDPRRRRRRARRGRGRCSARRREPRSRPASSTCGCTSRPRSPARRASWSDDWQAALPARSRREPRAADRPRQPGPLHEAVLEDGRVPRRSRRGRGPVPGRRARAGGAAARGCSGSPAIAPRACIRTSCRRSTWPGRAEILGADAVIAVELAVVLDTDPSSARDDRPPAHRDLRGSAELHEQPARVRLRRRRLRRAGAATGSSTRSSRGATSTRSCARVERDARRGRRPRVHPGDPARRRDPRAEWRELGPALLS